jgi:poly-gamma-glutamate capsule biosynthesis protein CapA/YwtB (metallophosphatase superfamily)
MIALRRNRRFFTLAVFSLSLSTVCNLSTAQTCQNEETSHATSEIITLKAVGDIVLGSDWPTSNYPTGFEKDIQTRLKQVLGDADVIFGNFEGALTTHDTTTKNIGSGTQFAFRMPPRFALLLKSSGFDVLNIANNHTFDFGQPGFSDTTAHLSKAGILVVGESNKIALQKINDVTLAWIGFSYLLRHNNVADTERLAELMQKARAQSDVVIVSMQAGAEGSEALKVRDDDEIFLGENRGNTFAFARRAVDLGADLVLGHGPHVLRGMECYKGKLIAYSLGNFVGYGALSIKRAASISAILEIKLAKNRQTLGFNVIPIKFNSQKLPEMDKDNLARHLINDLSRLPPLTGTVNLPTTSDGVEKYRRWLSASELIKILNE